MIVIALENLLLWKGLIIMNDWNLDDYSRQAYELERIIANNIKEMTPEQIYKLEQITVKYTHELEQTMAKYTYEAERVLSDNIKEIEQFLEETIKPTEDKEELEKLTKDMIDNYIEYLEQQFAE